MCVTLSLGSVWVFALVNYPIRRAQKKMNGGGGGVGIGAPAPATVPQPLEWKFSQVFGERAAGEEVQEGTLFNNIVPNFVHNS